MSTRQLLQRSMNSLQEKGVTRTAQSLMSVFEDLLFDKRYRLNTREIVDPTDLYPNEDEKRHNHWYQGTRLRHFRFLMQALRLPENSVFVDVGSGKGKVLLMASEYNFKRVVGIELSHELNMIAQSNLSTFQRRKKKIAPIEIHEVNALDYTFTDDENVIYFFNPFSLVILERFIEMIDSSLQRNPRGIWLIFNNVSHYVGLSIQDSSRYEKSDYVYGGTEFVIYKCKAA